MAYNESTFDQAEQARILAMHQLSEPESRLEEAQLAILSEVWATRKIADLEEVSMLGDRFDRVFSGRILTAVRGGSGALYVFRAAMHYICCEIPESDEARVLALLFVGLNN